MSLCRFEKGRACQDAGTTLYQVQSPEEDAISPGYRNTRNGKQARVWYSYG